MNVTKLEIIKDFILNDKVRFAGNYVYVSDIYRMNLSTVDISDVYDADGNKIGRISGHWFDFGGGDIFKSKPVNTNEGKS